MLLTSNRWLLLIALLLSGALWLAISSVMGNAIHTLAKESFTWYRFGSVSIGLILICLIWVIFVSCILWANGQFTAQNQFLSLCCVTVWMGLLLVLLAYGDPWIDSFGTSVIFGLLFWIIEIAGAALLVAHFFRQSVPFMDLQSKALLVAVTLTWLTAAKAALLCLSPGVSIRL